MKNLNLLIVIWIISILFSACYYSPADEYIQDHTEYDWYTDNTEGFVIDFLMEKSANVSRVAVAPQTLLKVNSVVYYYTKEQHTALKSITMWVSASASSWDAFNNISPDGSLSYADTAMLTYDESALDSFIIAVNYKVWNESGAPEFLHYYIHELVHYIAGQERNGDTDHNHQKAEYWGENGLFTRLVQQVEKKLGIAITP